MILIAPDKFKGTLTASQAASIIANAMHPLFCLKAPMADGGEGTARALANQNQAEWQERDGYYVHPRTRTAAIDSSAVIGIGCQKGSILRTSSLPLGLKVREILKGGCERVIIGVGGTGTCDGGEGFIEGLGVDHYRTYADKIIGLCDVVVPLLSDDGGIDALSFAPQKGATAAEMPLLRQRLENAQRKYSHGRKSKFDGAGGGLGFAIATAIGAKCYSGAQYVLGHYGIDWRLVTCAVTGEGRIDSQTSCGKAAHAVAKAAAEHGVPYIAIGGCVADGMENRCLEGGLVLSTEKYYPELPLDSDTAAKRLAEAATEARRIIEAGLLAGQLKG